MLALLLEDIAVRLIYSFGDLTAAFNLLPKARACHVPGAWFEEVLISMMNMQWPGTRAN